MKSDSLLFPGNAIGVMPAKESNTMKIEKAQIIEIGEANFNSEVLWCKQPVLVAFLAPWSQPCRIIRPILDEIALACAGAVKVVNINADDFPDLGIWYEIQSIPTLLCFVNGEVRARIVGTATKKAILSKLAPLMPSARVQVL